MHRMGMTRRGIDGLRLMSKRLGVERSIEYMLRYCPEARGSSTAELAQGVNIVILT